jgi:glycosyltransferase involved in cell wall biosynthesis
MHERRVMRISYLYDVPLPAPLAAPIQIVNTCRELAAAGIPTTLFVRELRSSPAACLAFYGVDPHPDLAIRPLFSRLAWRLYPPCPLTRLLADDNEHRPHVIISRGETAVEVARWLGRVRRRDALFVYEAHRLCFAHLAEHLSGKRWDETTPRAGPVRRLYLREAATVEAADGVVCLTNGVQQALTRMFALNRPSLVLPSGTSVPTDAMVPTGERDIDVLYVGKLRVRKGVRLLLAAMRHLPGRRLCVVGGSPAEVAACRELARAHVELSRTDFTGFVEPGRVQDYLRRSRVGVCPLPLGTSVTSEQFTSPLKLLQMMAYGVPVVASDVPAIRDIVTHGETAWLVASDDPKALAAGLRTLLEDPELARRLAAAARRRVMAFSWPQRAVHLRAFLETLAARPGSKAHTADAQHG